jgi:hypothetical protein
MFKSSCSIIIYICIILYNEIILFIAKILNINKSIVRVSQTKNIAIISIFDNIISVKNLCELYNIINDNTIYLMSGAEKIKIYIDLKCLHNAMKKGE